MHPHAIAFLLCLLSCKCLLIHRSYPYWGNESHDNCSGNCIASACCNDPKEVCVKLKSNYAECKSVGWECSTSSWDCTVLSRTNTTRVNVVDINISNTLHVVDERFVSFTLDTKHARWALTDAAIRAGHKWRYRGTTELDQDPQFIDWEEPTMIAMAKSLSPAYFRIGGCSADNITYESSSESAQHYVPSSRGSTTADVLPHSTLTPDALKEPLQFATSVGWDVIFALNIFDGWEAESRTWNGDRAAALMKHTKDMGYPVVAWELGDEPDVTRKDISASEVASAFERLLPIVKEVYGSTGQGTRASPWIVGPDTTSSGTTMHFPDTYLAAVLESFMANCTLDVVTWHHYYVAGELNDNVAPLVGTQAVKTYQRYFHHAMVARKVFDSYLEACGGKPHAQLWLGESSGAGAATLDANDVIGKAVEIFWYADKLGVSARGGNSAVFKQQWIDTAVADSTLPVYWVALLWRRLMGQSVLKADSSGLPDTLRLYAHKDGNGRVTVLLINIADAAVDVSVTLESTLPSNEHEEYHLSAKNGDVSDVHVLLNGILLPSNLQEMSTFLENGSVPFLKPRLSSSSTVKVEALSVVFVRFSL